MSYTTKMTILLTVGAIFGVAGVAMTVFIILGGVANIDVALIVLVMGVGCIWSADPFHALFRLVKAIAKEREKLNLNSNEMMGSYHLERRWSSWDTVYYYHMVKYGNQNVTIINKSVINKDLTFFAVCRVVEELTPYLEQYKFRNKARRKALNNLI